MIARRQGGSTLRWRPAAAGALLVGLLALLLPSGALGQQRIKIISLDQLEQPSGSDGVSYTTGISETEALRSLFLEWRQSIEEGNNAEANDLLVRMREFFGTPGVGGKQVLLGAFVALGRDWQLAENADAARSAFEAALILDPTHAPALVAQAGLAWQAGTGASRFIGAATGVVQAWRAAVAHPLGRLRVLSNGLLVGVVALMLAACGFALVQLVKYNRLLRHGAREALTDRVPGGVDGVLAWAIVFLPVLLFLSPAWWIVYWLVVLRAHGTAGERRLGLAALVCIALIPPAFHVVSVLSALPRDPLVRAVQAIQTHDIAPGVADDVARMGSPADQHAEHGFLLGLLHSGANRADDAMAAFGAAAEHGGPIGAKALVNRGNVHFRRPDLTNAVADYKLATEKDPDDALAWRNGSLALAQNLQTDQAREWLSRAQTLDTSAVRAWGDAVGHDAVVDASLTRMEFLRFLLTTRPDLVGGLLRSLFNPVSIAALLGILIVLIRRDKGLFAASACEKCGRAFCGRCHASAKTSAYCTQCTHLYVKKDGVSPVVRTAKLREVERWVALNGLAIRFFNLLLPGAGSLYANRLGVGTLLLIGWSTAVALLAAPLRVRRLVDPTRLGEADLAVLFGLQVLLLLVVYLVAVIQSLRHPD